MSGPLHLPNNVRGVPGVVLTRLEVVVAVATAIAIGHRHLPRARRFARTALALVPIWADRVGGGGIAVVGAVDGENVVSTGHRASDAQSEIVGLAARADQKDNVEALGQRVAQALAVLRKLGIDEPAVGVETSELSSSRFDHSGMIVTSVRDVVDGVEIL